MILYLENGTSFQMLRHPLLYSVPYSPSQNALINKRYELICKRLDKAKREKDYESYVFIYERPYRLNAFIEIESYLDDKEYWKLLSSLWVDSENIWQNIKTWKKLLKKKQVTKNFFMSEEDKSKFDKLPDLLTVYRGYRRNKDGLSYTLDKEKAIWFSKRFHKEGNVLEVTIPKSKIFAYTNSRSEQEIIILK